MHVYDLSLPLDENTQLYPGSPCVVCEKSATVEKDGYNVVTLTLGSHSGTHIDVPYHFVADGKTTDKVDLGDLVGPAIVLDVSAASVEPRTRITWSDLVKAGIDHLLSPEPNSNPPYRIVLAHTGWQKYYQTPRYNDHPFFDNDVAENLLKRGVRVFGVDTLSPDETPPEHIEDFVVHYTLLGAGAMIIENLTNQDSLLPPKLNLKSNERIHVSLLPLSLTGKSFIVQGVIQSDIDIL